MAFCNWRENVARNVISIDVISIEF